VSGSADWTNPTAPSNTGWFRADSRAIQTSTISADQISVNASLLGNTRVSLAGPYGPTNAFGSSIFEVTFDLAAPVEYTLGISRSAFGHDLPRPNTDFSLSSATYGSILDNSTLSLFSGTPFSGVLMPDIYTLRFNADFSAVADPLGDVKVVDYSMNLSVAQVPDAGSSITLLVMALAGLFVLKLKVTRETAVHF
jgi:VPDSG-CTERM motif